MNEPQVERAALVVQLADGTRMLYELDPRSPIVMSMSYPMRGLSDLGRTELNIEGTMLYGTIWEDDMPAAQREQINQPTKEITP